MARSGERAAATLQKSIGIGFARREECRLASAVANTDPTNGTIGGMSGGRDGFDDPLPGHAHPGNRSEHGDRS